MAPFSRWQNGGSERVSPFCKAPQLIKGRGETQVSCPQITMPLCKPHSFTSSYLPSCTLISDFWPLPPLTHSLLSSASPTQLPLLFIPCPGSSPSNHWPAVWHSEPRGPDQPESSAEPTSWSAYEPLAGDFALKCCHRLSPTCSPLSLLFCRLHSHTPVDLKKMHSVRVESLVLFGTK